MASQKSIFFLWSLSLNYIVTENVLSFVVYSRIVEMQTVQTNMK